MDNKEYCLKCGKPATLKVTDPKDPFFDIPTCENCKEYVLKKYPSYKTEKINMTENIPEQEGLTSILSGGYIQPKSRITTVIFWILIILFCILAEILIHRPMRHIFPNW